jgi:hypothetical protein
MARRDSVLQAACNDGGGIAALVISNKIKFIQKFLALRIRAKNLIRFYAE